MKDTKNKVTAIAMATTIAVTSMAQVPATTVYAQELDKPQIEAKVNEENKEQDNVKVEAPVIENKKDEEVKEETNTVENNENADDKENINDKVNEEEKDNVKEEEIKDNVENKEETEVKNDEIIGNTEIKDGNEKVEDKTSEKVENEELSKTGEVENKENEEKDKSVKEKATGIVIAANNFPDEEFRKFVSDNFDKDNDGVLSEEEANNVREINIGGREANVVTLKGIEHFKNLETLYCYEMGLTSLDVSKNTALKNLYCMYTEITSLDVSKNTELETLACQMTGITSLDVSKNLDLRELDCINTEITSLNIGNNPNLTSINKGNTIKELTVTGNTFDITKELYIIDVTKIENIQGAKLNGNIVSGYSYGSPITFEYNCGT